MADDDLDILAWTMLGEAGGEGPQGMSDVAHVVLNRLNAGNYGSSIQDVALSPKQFSTWNSGSGGNDPKGKYPKDSPEFQRARQLAEQVIGGQIPGPPGRPLDYNAKSVSPYWADSKSQNGTYERNGHVFYPSVPVPPGELPEVASLQDTRRTPSPVVPVTATPDMSLMRSNAAPSQLIPDTFASLPKPRNLGDELGMNPIQGGTQQAPMFDAGFDERLGAMRTFPTPMDTQGMFTARSPAPPPVPASVEDRVTARNTALPPIVRLPELPPSRLGQAPIPASVEDRVTARNRVPSPVGLPPSTRTVASVPMPARPSIPQTYAGMERSPPPVPDRLTPGLPGMPAVYGDFAPQQVAQIGVPAFPDPLQPRTQVASAAPFPMPRPSFMPQVGTQLAVTPPQLPGRRAPVPMPANMRPFAGAPQTRAPLRITVNGANPLPAPAAPRMSPAQQYEALNQAAAQRARDRSGNTTERSDYFKMATGG